MKKIILILIFILILILSLFFIKNNNIENWNIIKKDLSNSSSWTIINEITKEDIVNACNEIIKWWDVKYVQSTNLYWTYKNILDTYGKKSTEYLEFLNLKKWNCEFFKVSEENKQCILFKEKDIESIEKEFKKWSYERILVTSMMLNINKCWNLAKEEEKLECNTNFKNFVDIEKLPKWNIIWSSSIKVWKFFNELWKDEFMKKINSEFLGECINIQL